MVFKSQLKLEFFIKEYKKNKANHVKKIHALDIIFLSNKIRFIFLIFIDIKNPGFS